MSNGDNMLGQTGMMTGPQFGMKPWESIIAFLSGLQFPATKQAIIAKLRSRGGMKEELAYAEKIPDRQYTSAEDVRTEFAKVPEVKGSWNS